MAIGTGNPSHGDAIAQLLSLGRPRARPSGRHPMPIDAMPSTGSGKERLPEAGSASVGVGRDLPPHDLGRDPGHGSGRGERHGRRRTGRERLEATDARLHVVTDREPGGMGCGTFTNETSSTATLVALDCPAFDRVELRETFALGGVTRTRRTGPLSVLPGDSVELAPGGRLLSMTGPRRPLGKGELVGVTMIFASGRRRVVPFRVVADIPSRHRDDR